jgi:hypothetical protein
MPLTDVLSPRRGEHHYHADDADCGPQQVPPVRSEPVYENPPEQSECDKDASVSSVDPPELGDRLQRGHHPVGREDQCPEERLQQGLVLAHPPPHEVPTADLAQPRQHEQPPDDEQPLHPLVPPGRLRTAGPQWRHP